MKQKEIYIDPNLNIEFQKVVEMYFAAKTVSGIEGFVYMERMFLNIYKNSYAINSLRSLKYYSVYITHRHNCFREYNFIVRSRALFYQQLKSTILTCIECGLAKSAIEMTLGQKLR